MCETNFVLKFVILGRRCWKINLVVGSGREYHCFDLVFESNSTRIVDSQPRRILEGSVFLYFTKKNTRL